MNASGAPAGLRGSPSDTVVAPATDAPEVMRPPSAAAMDRGPLAATGFALALLILVVGPALLPAAFAPYPLLRLGDLLDLATPLVLVPAAWLAFRYAAVAAPSILETLAFLVALAVVIEGQGIHLAANAIGHLVTDTGDLGRLVYDLDEVISHYVWHAGLIGLTCVIGLRAIRTAPMPTTRATVALTVLGVLAFGFTFFAMVIEGETGPMGVPAALLLGVSGVALVGRRVADRPAAAVFALGYLLAIALFVVWAGMNGWALVPPSELDMIA